MSVGVYRVNEMKIEHENVQSFNLWDDDKLVSYFEVNESGITDVHVDLIKMALEDKTLNLSEDVKESLKSDIEFAQKKGQNYVSYITY
jgi:hypothetical protein